MKEMVLSAKLDALQSVLEFMDAELEMAECPIKTQFSLDIALEEMYVNVANYAYPDENASGEGMVKIQLDMLETPQPGIKVTLIDQGIPFDPLAKPDPDVSLSAEERAIGGLGIYMVKKSMDITTYEYKDGSIIFSMTKYF